MDLDKAIKSRKSAKKFKNKKPDWKDIIECVDSMRYAPMAGGNFSLKFIIVDDKEKIHKIAKAAQQNFISEADYVLVVVSLGSRTTTSYGKRGEIYLRQQAGAAIQNFLLKIQEKGLATCWVGHFVENQIKRELKIPEDVSVEAVFPIGYTSPEIMKKEKKKISMDGVLYFNKYENKKMKRQREFSA